MYYEFNLGDLKEILDYVEDIKEHIDEELLGTMQKYAKENDTGDYPVSKFYYEGVIPGMEEQQEQLEDILEHVEELEDKLKEIIDAIEHTDTVDHEDAVFIYEPKKLNDFIEDIKELLSRSNPQYKNIFTSSDSYKHWEKEVTNKLDDPDANILDAWEEIKQRDDEKVFRYNRSIMRGLDAKLAYVVPNDFQVFKDKMKDIKKKLDKLGVLDDILGLGMIARNSTKYGSADREDAKVNVLNMDEVNTYIDNKFIPNLEDILDHFKKGDTLVIAGASITDEILKRLNNSGLFKIELVDGKYRLSAAYDNIEDWAKDYPHLVEEILNDAFEGGLDGVYKFDPDSGKWYTYDEAGNIKYYTELPSGVGSMLEGANKILGPLGYAIDAAAMAEAIKSGDLSNILSTAGSIGGSWAGARVGTVIASAIATEGTSLIYGIVGGVIGGIIGGTTGGEIGEALGELIENGDIYWESNE